MSFNDVTLNNAYTVHKPANQPPMEYEQADVSTANYY
ncbi:hypothetical protein T01_15279 [Trichinella spiralis]|uniref:Uncharacterized protein n=1 Tax=Trichinella spiralis TaxID=6334 RepID=A0A0V1AKI6_TRISP|nr:hypothetical protein T01_15279 [Trichinella spiralis]